MTRFLVWMSGWRLDLDGWWVRALRAATEPGEREKAIRPSDPLMILAGIKQFGLAADGADLRDLEAAIRALSTASPPKSEAGKTGWKMVPVEPTEEMRRAGETSNYHNTARGCFHHDPRPAYAAMLAASPSVPTGAQDAVTITDEMVEGLNWLSDQFAHLSYGEQAERSTSRDSDLAYDRDRQRAENVIGRTIAALQAAAKHRAVRS